MTERSLGRRRRVRANLCPDIVQQIDREFEDLSRNNTHYSTEHLHPILCHPTIDQYTQTRLHIIDTGAQYSSPAESSDNISSDSESDSEIEGTENITIAKQYLHRHSISQEDLYNYPTPPHKRFRTSTPDPTERRAEEEPRRCPLREIVNHKPALNITPVDLIVAPGQQAINAQVGLQRVNAMSGRGRNTNQALQGADPALVQILQMMQNRNANRDNSRN